ncbi:F-box protein 11 [Ureibacillus xyleni]|uniref:F-box protein 11 n=1 Tax=Ureibacillus xyleni TaxID=614648 RepID=A0A285SEI2_9BACL|nr:right-handed parallel beta-helix repeat-containing protein [Ureibacillus xyleni]SOC06297.1 F-box protein 11 [Ureibacillus xyleni]
MAMLKLFSKFFKNAKSIQKMVQYSKNGNFIQLKPKCYKESVHFDKNTVIAGDKLETTIIEGFFIIPKNVTVSFQNVTISPTSQMYIEGDVVLTNCHVAGAKTDVLLVVDGGKIKATHCEFKKARDIGISLINNSKAIIENCIFEENGKAHILAESSQICMENSELSKAKHALLIKNKSLLQTKNVHIHHHTNTQVVIDDAKYFDHESTIERGDGMGLQVIHKGHASLQTTNFKYNALAQISGQNSYLTIRNCTIQHGKDVGVTIQGHCEAQLSYCQISQHKNTSIEVFKQSNMNIEYSLIDGSEHQGINIRQKSIVNLYDVIVKGHRASQIFIIDKSICSMKKCMIKEGYHVGICIEDASSCAVVESEICHNANSAVTVFKSEFSIFQSTLTQNAGNGILAMTDSGIEVDECKFYDNEMPHIACKSNVTIHIEESELFKGKSLFIVNECELTAVNSQFYDSHNVQVEICDLSTARFENCQIYNGGSYGMKVMRNSNCFLMNSSIFRHELSQMVVNDSSVILKDSEVFAGSRHAFYIQNHSEVLIQDTFISKHAQHQIWIDFESTVDLKGVQLTDGTLSDIYAQNQSSVYVADSMIRNNNSRYNVQAVNFSKIEIGNSVIENKYGDVYYSENHSFIKQLDY